MSVDFEVFIIGAGPAGLTAAYCLTESMTSVAVIEKDVKYVGGISRTVRIGDPLDEYPLRRESSFECLRGFGIKGFGY